MLRKSQAYYIDCLYQVCVDIACNHTAAIYLACFKCPNPYALLQPGTLVMTASTHLETAAYISSILLIFQSVLSLQSLNALDDKVEANFSVGSKYLFMSKLPSSI